MLIGWVSFFRNNVKFCLQKMNKLVQDLCMYLITKLFYFICGLFSYNLDVIDGHLVASWNRLKLR